jgi:diadenosine tetraphosphate (Ap4A) HIT family hydrolase
LKGRIVASNSSAFTIRDDYPVSAGHTLAIPNRHVGSFFDLSPQEHDALFEIVREQQRVLDGEFSRTPSISGINDGPAAGHAFIADTLTGTVCRRLGDLAALASGKKS